MARLSNDLLDLVPRTELEGRELTFELDGLEIGCAEYDEGPTGCTVFCFPAGAAVQIDVRGGSPGTLGAQYEFVHAVCLSGGSLYGLEAASGVAAELFARREYRTGWMDIPLVAGAIIFDSAPAKTGSIPTRSSAGRRCEPRAPVSFRSARVGPGGRRLWERPSTSKASSRAGRAARSA